jgi:hypothetical protein
MSEKGDREGKRRRKKGRRTISLRLAWHGGKTVDSERQAWILKGRAAALFAKEVGVVG